MSARTSVLVASCALLLACSDGTAPSKDTNASGGTSSTGGSASGGSNAGGTQGDAGGAGGTVSTGGTSAAGTDGSGGSGATGGSGSSLPNKVLLYHFSTLEIASVPAQITFLTETLTGWGFEVEESVDPASFTAENLANFGAVAMINTCFEPFGAGQAGTAETTALEAFVQNGGGLFGTHCAAVTFQTDNPAAPYNELIGGRGGNGFFEGTSSCHVDVDHPTTTGLAADFDYTGNLDNIDFLAEDSVVLVTCTWADSHESPASWYREVGSARIFYSNFAKEDVNLKDAALGAGHILAGLGWVLHR